MQYVYTRNYHIGNSPRFLLPYAISSLYPYRHTFHALIAAPNKKLILKMTMIEGIKKIYLEINELEMQLAICFGHFENNETPISLFTECDQQ
jgi:hypothetical protein